MSNKYKATALAPSNLAFVKYWGRKDETLRLPTNASLSVALSGMTTKTTVEFSDILKKDEIVINETSLEDMPALKVTAHLDRVRKMSGISLPARVVSQNSFPTGTGLSSSSSGFAALSVAATAAAGLSLSKKDLSILSRQGSGSACRSIPDGFCEWYDGDSSDTSYAETLFPSDHWGLSFVVGVVSDHPKHVSSSDGQMTARTSPFFETRLKGMDAKIEQAKLLLRNKDFTPFGELVEAEALELHTIMLTQRPSLIYWTAGTVELMQLCQKWREDSIVESYFSVNTGQDIYFMVRREDEAKLVEMLKATGIVKDIIINHPGKGATLSDNHLF